MSLSWSAEVAVADDGDDAAIEEPLEGDFFFHGFILLSKSWPRTIQVSDPPYQDGVLGLEGVGIWGESCCFLGKNLRFSAANTLIFGQEPQVWFSKCAIFGQRTSGLGAPTLGVEQLEVNCFSIEVFGEWTGVAGELPLRTSGWNSLA